MSAATKRLLIGVMSVLQERDRRDAFRDTWLPEMAPAVAVTRFVLENVRLGDAGALGALDRLRDAQDRLRDALHRGSRASS